MSNLFEELRNASSKKKTVSINGVSITVRSLSSAEFDAANVFKKGIRPPAIIDPASGRKTGDDLYDPDYQEKALEAQTAVNHALLLAGCPDLAASMEGKLEDKIDQIGRDLPPIVINTLIDTIYSLSHQLQKEAEAVFLEESHASPSSQSTGSVPQPPATKESPKDSPVPTPSMKKSKSGAGTDTPTPSGETSPTT